MPELSQPLQVEEVDALPFEEPVQATAPVRMPPLHDEELPEVAHDTPLAGPPSPAQPNVLGSEAERFLPAVKREREKKNFDMIIERSYCPLPPIEIFQIFYCAQ